MSWTKSKFQERFVCMIFGLVMVVIGVVGLATNFQDSTSGEYLLMGVFLILLPFVYELIIATKKKHQNVEKTSNKTEKEEKSEKEIVSVKLIRIKPHTEKSEFGVYKSTIFSFSVTYKDGSRETVECDGQSEEFKTLSSFSATLEQANPSQYIHASSKDDDVLSLEEIDAYDMLDELDEE